MKIFKHKYISTVGAALLIVVMSLGLIRIVSDQAEAAGGVQRIDDTMLTGKIGRPKAGVKAQALPNNFVKVLKVPYFNQWVDPVGSSPEEYYARRMCSAASSTMVAGYFNKIGYDKNNEQDAKRFMYSDQGLNLPTKCSQFGIGGTFGMTASDKNCWAGTIWNVEAYYNRIGLGVERLGGWVYGMGNLSFNQVVNSINRGRPVVISSSSHYVVIKGYTDDGRIIVNDSFKDASKGPDRKYIYGNGKDAVYDVNNMYPFDAARYQDHYAAFSIYDQSNPYFDDSVKPTPPLVNSATGKISSAQDNAVFDVRGVDGSNAASVWMSNNWNGINQKFDYDPKSLMIKGLNNRCLAFFGYNSYSDRQIRMFDCNPNDARFRWFYNDVGSLVSATDKTQCMDRYSAQDSRQNELYVGGCHFLNFGRMVTNQTFILPNVDTSQLNRNAQTLYTKSQSSTVFSTLNALVGNQIRIILAPVSAQSENLDKSNSQRWWYDQQSGEIRGVNSMCLDGGNDANWASGSEELRIAGCHGGGNQKWTMTSSGQIQSRSQNQYCLGVNSIAINQFVYIKSCNSSSTLQQFGLGGSSTEATITTKSGGTARKVSSF